MTFDSVEFERLRVEGVRLHNAGLHDQALDVRKQAHNLAPPDSLERGIASRDIGATCAKQGKFEAAALWAEKAYGIHQALADQAVGTERPAALHEFAASTAYVGLGGLGRYMRGRFQGMTHEQLQEHADLALEMMEQAWSILGEIRRTAAKPWLVGQYEINIARRVSVTKSLLGDQEVCREGLRIARHAVAIAFWSESSSLPNATRGMSPFERMRAKAKAAGAGVIAVAASVLAAPGNGHPSRAVLWPAAKII